MSHLFLKVPLFGSKLLDHLESERKMFSEFYLSEHPLLDQRTKSELKGHLCTSSLQEYLPDFDWTIDLQYSLFPLPFFSRVPFVSFSIVLFLLFFS
jgi:hypothetical protein